MRLRTILQNYRERRQFAQFQRENTWEGLVPGDLVEYKDQQYMYRGINKNGGPGMAMLPEPMFGPDRPSVLDRVWYLRTEFSYPFGNLPDVMKESAQPAQVGGGTYIAFLNATRVDLKKVGHISPDEWRKMVEELQRELAGRR